MPSSSRTSPTVWQSVFTMSIRPPSISIIAKALSISMVIPFFNFSPRPGFVLSDGFRLYPASANASATVLPLTEISLSTPPSDTVAVLLKSGKKNSAAATVKTSAESMIFLLLMNCASSLTWKSPLRMSERLYNGAGNVSIKCRKRPWRCRLLRLQPLRK